MMARYIDVDKIDFKKILVPVANELFVANGSFLDNTEIGIVAFKKDIDEMPSADVELVRHGHWVLEARHFFNDFGECNVYVFAVCSECKERWRGIVFDRTLYAYSGYETPNPITEERIRKCKEDCLQQAEKYILIESPFCEKCGAKMDGKENKQ